MTFRLPNPPSPKAGTHELADFVELLCWIGGTTSAREIVAHLGHGDDNDINNGCYDDEDENTEVLDDVMIEIERRADACHSGYPFALEPPGTVLRCSPREPEEPQSIVYLYLLLSTRLNMMNNRRHAGIDGANLLEALSAHVLKNYLGGTVAKSRIFGTSRQGTFRKRIIALCEDVGEGSGFSSLDKAPVRAKDDKLDAVAWVPFSDRLPGQLIIFCQCKTGSSWYDSTTQLQPETFIEKWMSGTVLVKPLRAFCVSESADRSRWNGYNLSAGILFDRCRLVEFSETVPDATMSKIRTWTLAAKEAVDLMWQA